jgi:hypothetical protein
MPVLARCLRCRAPLPTDVSSPRSIELVRQVAAVAGSFGPAAVPLKPPGKNDLGDHDCRPVFDGLTAPTRLTVFRGVATAAQPLLRCGRT